MRENRKLITRVSSDEARVLRDDTADARLDAMTDDDIARAVADDPDAVPIDIDWTTASLVIPPGKEVVTMRLDRDLLDWFRGQGKGYQTRINQVLRVFYESRPMAPDVVEGSSRERGLPARSEDPVAELARLVEFAAVAEEPTAAAKKAAKPPAPAKKRYRKVPAKRRA